MPTHKHGEAFALMRYESKDKRIVEYLWNSRDGVTPFGLRAKDGLTDLYHVNWQGDERRPTHIPQVGDRIFVTMTAKHAAEFAEKMVDRESVGPNADLWKEMYGTDRAAAVAHWTETNMEEVKRGGPVVEVVTAEMHAFFSCVGPS